MITLLRRAGAAAIISTISFIAISPGYGAEPRMEGDAKKSAEVWSTFQRWLQAYQAGDIPGIMAIFDREVVFSFQGTKDQSYLDLRRGYEVDLKSRTPGTIWVPLVEQIYADGNLAFVRAVWELRASNGAGTFDVKARNQSLDVLRNLAGHWSIIRSINYPEKP